MGGALHEGELVADAAVVTALLAQQAPHLAGLPVRPIRAVGTVNRVFRLGEALAVRLPRLAAGGEDTAREAAVVPIVARALPVAVPEQVLLGSASPGLFPAAWSIVRWIDGDPAEAGSIPVEQLADVIAALRAIDPAELPRAGRATAEVADPVVRTSIAALQRVDRTAVSAAWDGALRAPRWDGVRVAVHADLLPPNLLVRDGRLVGVLDWGGAGAGDPANDLVPAWSCLRGPDRARFRARLAPHDGTWARARGVALAQAVVAIPYYERTNPAFAALCRSTLTEVLADPEG